jgi:hypothetical protein
MADNLPPSSADVMESGSLNLPESSGPYSPVMGLIYLYLLVYVLSVIMIRVYDILYRNMLASEQKLAYSLLCFIHQTKDRSLIQL